MQKDGEDKSRREVEKLLRIVDAVGKSKDFQANLLRSRGVFGRRRPRCKIGESLDAFLSDISKTL